MQKEIEEIHNQGKTIAIIIRNSFDKPGITFFTGPQFSQQLAHMHHSKGKTIEPHIHNPVARNLQLTQEVLVIKQGSVRVDFYDPQQQYLESRILRSGDVMLLAEAGHGFEVLEDLIMFEIKQGPYTAEQDKTRFHQPEPFTPKLVD